MNTAEAQEAIFEALVARGYTAGLTAEQLTARQVCKMLEEVCELAMHVKGFSAGTATRIYDLHDCARFEFDDLARWQAKGGIKSYAGLKAELPDVQTTVANTAEALTWAWADESPFDVMQEAVNVSCANVARGVR
jgi:hypothetical protein